MALRDCEYECPICFEELSTPIFQCYEGHLLCQFCIKNMTTCPICQEVIPPRRIRNREIEKIISWLTDCEKENYPKNASPEACHFGSMKHAPAIIEAVRDEDGKHRRVSSSRKIPQSLTIKMQDIPSVFFATNRPMGLSPPTPTTFKNGLEIDGIVSSHGRIITNGNNNSIPPSSAVRDDIFKRLSDRSVISYRGSRPPPLSIAPSDQQNLISFDDEVPSLPSPPHTELLSSPVPPPVPPRRTRPSELTGLQSFLQERTIFPFSDIQLAQS